MRCRSSKNLRRHSVLITLRSCSVLPLKWRSTLIVASKCECPVHSGNGRQETAGAMKAKRQKPDAHRQHQPGQDNRTLMQRLICRGIGEELQTNDRCQYRTLAGSELDVNATR